MKSMSSENVCNRPATAAPVGTAGPRVSSRLGTVPKRTMLLMGACAALTLPFAATAAQFSNGDFESPGVAPGVFVSISDIPALAPTGWTTGGTTTYAAMFYENNVFGVIGLAGPSAIGFGGNGTTGSTLSQTFDTVAGTSYTVNYFVTAQQGVGAQSVMVQAFNGALMLGSSSGAIPAFGDSEWYHWFAGPSLSFLASSSSSTITFTDTSNDVLSASTNWALDGVTVEAGVGVPPVPEPSTYALMIAGLGIIGFMARRKDQA